MTPREIVTDQRPVCDAETPSRCRKTAVVSIDGVYRCEEHRQNAYGVQFAAFAIPIRWTRRTPSPTTPTPSSASAEFDRFLAEATEIAGRIHDRLADGEWPAGLDWGDVGDMRATVQGLRAVSDRMFAEGEHAEIERDPVGRHRPCASCGGTPAVHNPLSDAFVGHDYR